VNAGLQRDAPSWWHRVGRTNAVSPIRARQPRLLSACPLGRFASIFFIIPLVAPRLWPKIGSHLANGLDVHR